MPENQFYEFGPFILDTVQHLLLKQQEPVTLTPKTYDALLVLVRNSGRMLSKEELMAALWPDSFVEESNLTQQVSTIRKALGESPGEDRYIVTVPGRGYRFAAQVKAWSQEKAPAIADRPELVEAVEEKRNEVERPSTTVAASEKVLRMESHSPTALSPHRIEFKRPRRTRSQLRCTPIGRRGEKARGAHCDGCACGAGDCPCCRLRQVSEAANRPDDVGGTAKPGHSSVSESPARS